MIEALREHLFIVGGVGVGALYLLMRRLQFDTRKKLRGALVKLKDADIDYPGHMAFANKGGEYFHGCRVARFANVQELNAFFQPGMAGHLKLVGEVLPMPDSSILCVYTAKLTNEEMEDNDEWSRNQHEYFAQKKQKRQLEKQEAEEAALKEAAESKRLAAVGAKYEARVAKLRGLPPGSERKEAERKLNAGEDE